MKRVYEAELKGHASLLRGFGARALLEEITGRPPIWVPRLRGWSCAERTLRDAPRDSARAMADIVIVGPRAASSSGVAAEDRVDPGDGRW